MNGDTQRGDEMIRLTEEDDEILDEVWAEIRAEQEAQKRAEDTGG